MTGVVFILLMVLLSLAITLGSVRAGQRLHEQRRERNDINEY